jgi:hypothetical protein
MIAVFGDGHVEQITDATPYQAVLAMYSWVSGDGVANSSFAATCSFGGYNTNNRADGTWGVNYAFDGIGKTADWTAANKNFLLGTNKPAAQNWIQVDLLGLNTALPAIVATPAGTTLPTVTAIAIWNYACNSTCDPTGNNRGFATATVYVDNTAETNVGTNGVALNVAHTGAAVTGATCVRSAYYGATDARNTVGVTVIPFVTPASGRYCLVQAATSLYSSEYVGIKELGIATQ